MTGDLISREAALDVLRNAMSSFHIVGMRSGKTLLQSAVNEAFEGLNNLPAVDAAPVMHGRWMFPWSSPECSVCKKTQKWTSKYCPNCGAKMDKEE